MTVPRAPEPSTAPAPPPSFTEIYEYNVDEIRKIVNQGSHAKLSMLATSWIAKAKRNIQEGIEVLAAEKIEKEGILSADPRYQKSNDLLRNLPTLYEYSFCARILTGIDAAQCLAKARQGVFRWIHQYHSVGNPINDSTLILLYESIDWILPFLSKAEINELRDWLNEQIDVSDDFFSKVTSVSGRMSNNWNTWRLVLRMMASKLLAGINPTSDEVEETESLMDDHLKRNLVPPKTWNKDNSRTCANLKTESHYGSYDFRQRDALHYHTYNLKAWTMLGLISPNWLNESKKGTLKDALVFLKPYVMQEKQHIEFLCSPVKFDEQRRLAGQPEYQNEPWKPENSKATLLLAQVLFPEERQWTHPVSALESDPFFQFLAEYKNAYSNSR